MSVWFAPEINVLVIARMTSPKTQLVEWDWPDMLATGITYSIDKDLTEYYDWFYIGELD